MISLFSCCPLSDLKTSGAKASSVSQGCAVMTMRSILLYISWTVRVSTFEQCQMMVFAAHDLECLWPGIPDLVTELCPLQKHCLDSSQSDWKKGVTRPHKTPVAQNGILGLGNPKSGVTSRSVTWRCVSVHASKSNHLSLESSSQFSTVFRVKIRHLPLKHDVLGMYEAPSWAKGQMVKTAQMPVKQWRNQQDHNWPHHTYMMTAKQGKARRGKCSEFSDGILLLLFPLEMKLESAQNLS